MEPSTANPSPPSNQPPALTKKQAKAQRKAERLRDEQIAAATLDALNEQISSSAIDYLAILDFEATCDDKTQLSVQEIIEFPTVFVSTRTGVVEQIFHTYVRPEVHPILTAFCTELTGIAQATVEAGVPLAQALADHKDFLTKHNLVDATTTPASRPNGARTFVYATCGDWDLKTCLPKQLQHLQLPVPPPTMTALSSWINLKVAFQRVCGKKALGMTTMLEEFNLELQGRHHSGIDDCKNLARVVQAMMQEKGWKPTQLTGTTLRYDNEITDK